MIHEAFTPFSISLLSRRIRKRPFQRLSPCPLSLSLFPSQNSKNRATSMAMVESIVGLSLLVMLAIFLLLLFVFACRPWRFFFPPSSSSSSSKRSNKVRLCNPFSFFLSSKSRFFSFEVIWVDPSLIFHAVFCYGCLSFSSWDEFVWLEMHYNIFFYGVLNRNAKWGFLRTGSFLLLCSSLIICSSLDQTDQSKGNLDL